MPEDYDDRMPGLDEVRTVLSFYALDQRSVRKIEPLANAGGWSGSRLWRVTINSDAVGNALRGVPPGKIDRPSPGPPQRAVPTEERLCLRRWPAEHPTPAGLRLVHAVLGLVSPELPIVAFPLRTSSGSTVVEAAGHRWELANWLKGNADFHDNPARPRLRAAMQTLARFHVLAARYERCRGAAQAIDDRRTRLMDLLFRELATIQRSLSKRLRI